VRLSVLIPVYNEGATIVELVRRVRAVPLDLEVILVDDGSTDGTRDLLDHLPVDRLLLHDRNRGKGAAVRTALAAATGDVVVVQDGDLEYDPNDLVPMLKRIEQGAPVVYGSRILGGNPMSHLSFYLGGRLLSWLANRWYGLTITDEPTCYKMMRREVLLGLELVCEGFEFCPEVTAKLARRGHPIVEIPIRYQPRRLAEGKKIRARDGWIAIRTLWRYRRWR